MTDVVLTTPQSEFHQSMATYTAAVAGFGSGKTAVAIARILATKFEYPSIDLAYLAPTYALIRDIFYPNIATELNDIGAEFTINKSENSVYIKGHGKIICRTMDNPDLIVGWEVGDAFMDEFDILPKDKALQVIRKVSARCRQVYPDGKVNQKWITTTPEGFKATYLLFEKEPLRDSKLIQMSTYSNPHLPKEYVQDLKDQYPPQLIEAYLKGKFVNLVSGAVYYAFDRERVDTDREIQKGEPLHIGMDFNVSKMSACVFVDELTMVDELIGYYDTPDLIEAIQERFEGHKIYVYPDAAGKGRNTTGASTSDHKLLKLAGFTVKALRSNPLIKERVQSVNKVINDGIFKMNIKKCPQSAEAMEQQVYNNNGAPDKTQDLDHPNDAIGYRICKDHLISKPKINYKNAA